VPLDLSVEISRSSGWIIKLPVWAGAVPWAGVGDQTGGLGWGGIDGGGGVVVSEGGFTPRRLRIFRPTPILRWIGVSGLIVFRTLRVSSRGT